MVIAATRPILHTVIAVVKRLSNILPRKGATGFYFVVMCIVPLFGSFITEPAAMTLAALILSDKLFSQGISNKLKYMTLGALFVNVSIGGTLTNFAAPPILMVAQTWDWSSYFMLITFGWKAAIAIFLNTSIIMLFFFKELSAINIRTTVSDREKIPFVIVLILLFIFGFSGLFWALSTIFYESIFTIFRCNLCLSTISR